MTKLDQNDYQKLLGDIKQRIRSAQYEALKAVNKELISLYWDIGKIITERQKGDTWGKAVVERLASDLQTTYPGIQGFSARNIWRMRDFYLSYKDSPKLPPLVAEIGWTHNILIMEKCKDDLQREFYIRMIRKMGWTKNVLIHQIENQTYEKTLLNQTNFDKTVPEDIRNQAKLAVKDEFTFDFLEMGEEYKERELEQALMLKMDHFLREMGGHLAFVGSQYRLEVSDKEYFIDVLLYHRHLKSLIALELKIGEFQPEYVGKMQFYLAVLEYGYKLHLNLAGLDYEDLWIEFEPSKSLSSERDEQTYSAKIDNLKKLYDQGIIDQNQFAGEAGYEMPAAPEPRSPQSLDLENNSEQEDDAQSNQRKFTLKFNKQTGRYDPLKAKKLSWMMIGRHDGCGHNHERQASLVLDPATEQVAEFQGDYFKYVYPTLKRSRNDSLKAVKLFMEDFDFDTGDSDLFASGILETIGLTFGHSIAESDLEKRVLQQLTIIYAYFRLEDAEPFGGDLPIKPSFELIDEKAIEFLKKSDHFYFERYLTNPQTKTQLKTWLFLSACPYVQWFQREQPEHDEPFGHIFNTCSRKYSACSLPRAGYL